MARDLERLRRLAEDFGDPDAERALRKIDVRQERLRIDAILHVLKQAERGLRQCATMTPERLASLNLPEVRQHVLSGDLRGAAALARRVERLVEVPEELVHARELVGVFGCL